MITDGFIHICVWSHFLSQARTVFLYPVRLGFSTSGSDGISAFGPAGIFDSQTETALFNFQTAPQNLFDKTAQGRHCPGKETVQNIMFADRAKIFIKSGDGGDGHVSFRRELYVPAGGPDGGNGGRGGDIIFQVDEGLNTLTDFRYNRKYVAKNGEPGGKRRCSGKDAEDLVIKVPEGTVIRDFESGKVISDMSGENRREILLKGGRGGLGNMNFATSAMQAPRYAQPGQPGRELWVRLELKVIADVGLVGFPNAGKSTLLSRVSNARPKIADYRFTTLEPHLGVVDLDDGAGFVMADIPGLIEGASEGAGLGHDFLQHIERTKVLVHVVDAASAEGRDPVEDVRTICRELEKYDPELLKRPQIIAANKMDSVCEEEYDGMEEELAELKAAAAPGETDAEEMRELERMAISPAERLRRAFEPQGIRVYPVSAVSGQGIKELLGGISELLSRMDRTPVMFQKEFDIRQPDDGSDLPYTVERDEDGAYIVEGPRIEKMLGYTNLESEKGFLFFQKFLKDAGILNDLEKAGIRDGDTVRIYGFSFEYYR